MLKVIIGEKGTGKTKKLIDLVHQAEEQTNGSVVFINKGDRHIFDVSYRIRLVDTKEFDVATYASLYGLVCGMISQNYDIKNIFIDSLTKIAGDNMDEMVGCLDRLDKIAKKFEVEIVIIISMPKADAPEGVLKYAEE